MLYEEISKNPNISDSLLVRKMRIVAHKDLKAKLEKRMLCLKTLAQTNSLLRKERYALDIFIYNMEKVLETSNFSKVFSMDYYSKEFETMVNQFSEKPELQEKLWNETFTPIKTASSVQRALFPSNKIIVKTGSVLKLIGEELTLKQNVRCILPWKTEQVITIISAPKEGYLQNVGFYAHIYLKIL